MDISNTSGDPLFRTPIDPALRVNEASTSTSTAPASFQSRGGKRVGSGRRRVHEEGYSSVHNQLWRSISIHTSVYEEWQKKRKEQAFPYNSEFASFLLANIEGNISVNTNLCSDRTLERYKVQTFFLNNEEHI